jgi:hypothetical protein
MKYILLFILFICSSNITKAQDTLSMRSGENILVKVIEVGTAEVKYKKLDNLNGPVFSMLKSDLLMIKYENGTSEDYSKEERALIKVKKRHTVRNIGIVYGVLGVGVLIALVSVFSGGFRGGGYLK